MGAGVSVTSGIGGGEVMAVVDVEDAVMVREAPVGRAPMEELAIRVPLMEEKVEGVTGRDDWLERYISEEGPRQRSSVLSGQPWKLVRW